MPADPVPADDQNRLEKLLGTGIVAARHLGGQHGVNHYRTKLPDGRTVFVKLPAEGGAAAAAAGFAAEASGLRWLRAADAVAVPEVLAADDAGLAIEWIEPGSADRQAALCFGRELAALHGAGADRWGAPWQGMIAGLPMENGPTAGPRSEAGWAAGDQAAGDGATGDWAAGEQVAGEGADWAGWYAAARVLPYVAMARDTGTLSGADARLLEAAAGHAAAAAGPREPPARIHGDCWAGNVLWSGGRGWLVDPAAHGGHRETDLAMLSLFGAPHLDAILAGYQEVAPLADGWRARIPLHQLHPLLVHVCLFGAAYREPALTAARAVLAL